MINLMRHTEDINSTTKMDKLLQQFGEGFDYTSLHKISDIRNFDDTTVSVIVPVRGRTDFHQILVDHLTASFKNLPSGRSLSITFVEHSKNPEHRPFAEKSGVNYIHIPTDDVFNKCLAFNVGFLFSNKSEYYLFHDLDCMPQSNFWRYIFLNLDKTPFTSLQAFRDRRVLYCDQHTSDLIINKTLSVDQLSAVSTGITEPALHQWKAPGGSIFCPYNQFVTVGGFDPEYFFGYSIEDAFFYNKLEISGGITSCNNPQIEIFHLNHPPLWNSNPHLTEHHHIYENWMSLSGEEKVKLMDIKSSHLKKFIQ